MPLDISGVAKMQRGQDMGLPTSNLWEWLNGGLIPGLSSDDREFLITGLDPKEWMEFFDA